MISLFPKAQAAREELPQDPAHARLFFLSRHLDDLQSISLAGIAFAFIEMPLLNHLDYHTNLVITSATAAVGVAWYFACRRWYRARYGRSWADQSAAMSDTSWSTPTIIGFTVFQVLVLWSVVVAGGSSHAPSNLLTWMPWSMWMGRVTRDHTNLPLRRTVYKASVPFLLADLLFSMSISLRHLFSGSASPVRSSLLPLDGVAAIGLFQLSLALFDAWLLHHTFAQTQHDTKQAA